MSVVLFCVVFLRFDVFVFSIFKGKGKGILFGFVESVLEVCFSFDSCVIQCFCDSCLKCFINVFLMFHADSWQLNIMFCCFFFFCFVPVKCGRKATQNHSKQPMKTPERHQSLQRHQISTDLCCTQP